MAKKRTLHQKMIERYVREYPTQKAIIQANLAQLLRYQESRIDRNEHFFAIWQQVKAQTKAYLDSVPMEEIGSKEYKNMISVYMGFINYTRPQEEEALTLQLLAGFSWLDSEDALEAHNED